MSKRNAGKTSLRHGIILTLILLVGLGLAGSLQPVRAQAPSPVDMQVEPSLGGFFKYGEWMLLWVQLNNDGADINGDVRVDVQGSTGQSTYSTPVSLPAGARKRVPLYILANNFSNTLAISFVAEDYLPVTLQIGVQAATNDTFAIGLISPERDALALLAQISLQDTRRPLQLVDLQLENLPERVEALGSLDVLVINSVDTSVLTPGQQDALLTWVQRGGRLVLGGGSRGAAVLSGLPESLQVIELRNPVEVMDVDSMVAYSGADDIRTQGPFTIASGSLKTGHILAGDIDQPLVTETVLGSGVVNYIALETSGEPFNGWPGTAQFWSRLLSAGSGYPDWMPRDLPQRQIRADQLNYALTNLPVLDLPSVSVLSVLLALYILLVGPVNYVVLRVLKRLHWGWVTIPVVTLAFSGLAFGIGIFLRGSDVVVNKISMIELYENAPASINSYLGVFSPAQQSYEISVEGDGLLSRLTQSYDPWGGVGTSSAVTFEQGSPATVTGLAVNQYSMQAFSVEGVNSEIGELEAEARLTSFAFEGSLINRTGLDLKDCAVIFGSSFVRLGDLANGDTLEFSLPVNESLSGSPGNSISWSMYEQEYMNATGPIREVDVKRTILDTVFYPSYGGKFTPSGVSVQQAPYFIAWLDDAPPSVNVSGVEAAQQTSAMVLQRLSYSLPESGEISLPTGIIPGQITSLPVNASNCGPDATSLWMMGGQAEIRFNLPVDLQTIAIDSLQVNVMSDGGWWQAPSLAMYNWQTGAWDALESPSMGVNIVQPAADYLGPSGEIEVQLGVENNNGGGGCLYVRLGLTGQLQ